MEQRKLIKLGNSSFAIALPKDWVEKSGLKKGEDIFIERNANGEIIISSKFKKINGNGVKILDLTNVTDKRIIRRELSTAYVQDYSKLEIKGMKDKDKKAQVKEHAGYLMGLEIIESSEDSLVIKDFFDLSEVNINNFVRRIDNNLRGMIDEIEKGVQVGKLTQKQFSEIVEADDDINKFNLLINKILIKGMRNPSVLNLLKTDVVTLFNDWWVVYNLEHIGDEIKKIAKILKQESIKEGKINDVKTALSKLREVYDSTLTSYYKQDKSAAMSSIMKKEDLANIFEALSSDNEITVAKVGEQFKQISGIIQQVNKVILYNINS